MGAKAGSHLVGLDIGSTGARAVEVKWSGRDNAFRIAKTASIELAPGAVHNGVITNEKAVVKALKRLWRKGRFSTRKVIFGLADTSVLTRQMEVPWMPPDDFRTALRYQVGDVLPVDLATMELDYHLLGEDHRLDDNQQPVDFNRILLVAVNSEDVTTLATVLRHARLEPVAADSAAFALIRAACQGVMPSSTDAHAIVDLGAGQMTVVIHQAGQPRFIRTISNLGGEKATEAIADKLALEPEDAERAKRETGLNGPPPIVAPIAESSVFRDVTGEPDTSISPRAKAIVALLNPWATTVIGEIRNSLDYFQASDPNAPIQTLTISGRTAELDGLLERVATQIPLPVRRMDPLLGLSAPRKVTRKDRDDTRFVVAAGLAMVGRP
jgi:type IV pilus assembly protein PilM